jgi:hypothetical protein
MLVSIVPDELIDSFRGRLVSAIVAALAFYMLEIRARLLENIYEAYLVYFAA